MYAVGESWFKELRGAIAHALVGQHKNVQPHLANALLSTQLVDPEYFVIKQAISSLPEIFCFIAKPLGSMNFGTMFHIRAEILAKLLARLMHLVFIFPKLVGSASPAYTVSGAAVCPGASLAPPCEHSDFPQTGHATCATH